MKNYLKIVCPIPAVLEHKPDDLEYTTEGGTPLSLSHQKSVEAYVRDYLVVESKPTIKKSKP